MFNDRDGRGENSTGEHFRLLELAGILLSQRWRILLITAGAILLAIPIGLLMPRQYEARTLLIASTDGGGLSSQLLASQLPQGIPVGLLGGSGNPQHELVGVVVKSRSLADSIVARFASGQDEASIERMYEIRNALAYETEVETALDGSLRLVVGSSDAELAAQIANVIPEVVNRIMSSISAQEAVNKQQFLELQLAEATEALEKSETDLVRFQTVSAAPDIQEQARQTVEAAAELQQEILRQEIEVTQLRRSLTPDHPELQRATSALEAARAQLRSFTSSGSGGEVFLSMRQTPQLRAEAMRLVREHTRNEQVVISLTAALAQARIDARNTLPTVSVLDAALVPRQPTGIGIVGRLLMAALLGFVLGTLSVIFTELSRRARRDPRNEDFFTSWDELRSRRVTPAARE